MVNKWTCQIVMNNKQNQNEINTKYIKLPINIYFYLFLQVKINRFFIFFYIKIYQISSDF